MTQLYNIAQAGFGKLGGIQGVRKILKGGGIAGGGAAAYVALVAAGILPDLPGWAASAVTALLSAGINFLKVWLLKFDIKLDLDKA